MKSIEERLNRKLEKIAAHMRDEMDKIRVRTCHCGNAFIASTRYQKSCSARCRHKLYEKSPEFKAKRRKYMRDYYRTYMKDYRKRKP